MMDGLCVVVSFTVELVQWLLSSVSPALSDFSGNSLVLMFLCLLMLLLTVSAF